MTGARRLGALAGLALVLACAHARKDDGPTSRPPRESPAPPPGAGVRPPEDGQVGVASYYGKRFHGRRTASGARYDMNAMTCAHRTAPFGSRLKVTDLTTGNSVVVTVNDRGPFARGRVVDLSLGAARRLGMVERGVARVRVEVVDD